MKKILLSLLTFGSLTTVFSQYELDWNSRIGGVTHDDCRGIVESNDFIYVSGRIEDGCNFESGTTFTTETSAGADDIFIAKIDKNGNYIWVKSMGGNLSEQAVTIKSGPNGDLYITGFFQSTFDFDPSTTGTTTLTNGGNKDVFIARFSTDGDLVWVKQFSGTLDVQSESLAVNTDGIVITGRFKGTVDFDPSSTTNDLTSTGNNDVFVTKLDLDGNFVWANNYGTTANDMGWGVTVDASNAIYITGAFRNTIEFESGNIASQHTSNGGNDIFILKLNALGQYQMSKSIGSTGNDMGSKIELDALNNFYVSGFFGTTVDFDPSTNVTTLTALDARDAFLVQFNSNGDFTWATAVGSSTGDDKGKGITFDLVNNIYNVGTFSGTIDINGTTHTSNGLTDCFIQKLDQNGTVLWSETYGGTTDDFLNGIVVDADTSIYFNGKFSSATDIDPTTTINSVSPFGAIDGYIFKWKMPDVMVTSITTQGQGGVSVITVDDGTLQIEATILPANATDNTYTWSVTNGTGSATIDANGLLTAITNGIVTVTATANDGTTQTGSTDITLSNQTTVGLIEKNNTISSYPNPVKNQLSILGLNKNEAITIYSIDGTVHNLDIDRSENTLTINTSPLLSGVYFVKTSVKIIKFVK